MKIETGTARKEWVCNHNGCKKKIQKTEKYFLWHIAGGTARRQHQDHGKPAVKPATKKAVTKKKVTSKKKTTKKKAMKGGKK